MFRPILFALPMVLAILGPLQSAVSARDLPDVPQVELEHYRLANGLNVILHVDNKEVHILDVDALQEIAGITE